VGLPACGAAGEGAEEDIHELAAGEPAGRGGGGVERGDGGAVGEVAVEEGVGAEDADDLLRSAGLRRKDLGGGFDEPVAWADGRVVAGGEAAEEPEFEIGGGVTVGAVGEDGEADCADIGGDAAEGEVREFGPWVRGERADFGEDGGGFVVVAETP